MNTDWKEISKRLDEVTKSNGAIQKLTEFLKTHGYADEALMSTFTPMFNVADGKKLDWQGEMSDVGWAGGGCNPEYRTPSTNYAEKAWELGEWEMPLEWCYKMFENTVAEYALKKGTDIGDLTGTEIWSILIESPLAQAITNMFWRLIWFGDKAGANLTAGVDKTLFTACDGLWKRLFALGAANANQHTTIAANASASYAAQKADLRQNGVAISIFENLVDDADSRIEGLEGAAVFCTKSLADALARDLKNEYKLILTWEQIFGGLKVTEFDGKKIVAISKWDRMIQQYQDNGTKFNLPHRAIYTAPSQLLVGTPANEIVSDVDVNFDHKARTTYTYSTGKIGTLLGEDNLIQVAY